MDASHHDTTPERLEDHRDLIRRVARQVTRDLNEIDDVEGETVAAALGGRAPTDEGLAPWLATVARRVAMRRIDSGHARARRERAVARPDSSVPSPDQIVEAEETRRRVLAAVLALPTGQRDALLARYHLGLSEIAAAREIGVPVGTLRKRLQRGREVLRQRLVDEYGGDTRLLAAALLPLTVLGTPPFGLDWLAAIELAVQKKVTAAAGLLLALGSLVAWLLVASPFGNDEGSPRPTGTRTAQLDALELAPVGGVGALEDEVERTPLAPPPTTTTALWSGRVVDPDGAPVPDAQVVRMPSATRRVWLDGSGPDDPSARRTTTDEQGEFEFAAQGDVGGALFAASAEGFLPGSQWIDSPGAIELRLQRGLTVGGTVRDTNGIPVGGVRLELPWESDRVVGRSTGVSDSNGRFRLTGYPNSSTSTMARIVASADGWPTVGLDFNPYPALVLAGSRAEDGVDLAIDVELGLPRQLEVRVVDASGAPAVGVEAVAWFDPHRSRNYDRLSPEWHRGRTGDLLDRGWTDASGRWTTLAFPDTPPDASAQRADPLGWIALHRPGGAWIQVAVDARRDDAPLEVVLPDVCRVRGRVLDSVGEPVADARIRLVVLRTPSLTLLPGVADEIHQTRSAEDGSFRIESVPQGVRCRIDAYVQQSARHEWRYARTSPIERTLDRHEVDVVFEDLEPALRIPVRALDPRGRPLAGVAVGTWPHADSRITDAAGRAVLRLPKAQLQDDESIELGARHARFGLTRSTAPTSTAPEFAGREVELRFELPSRVAGRVVDQHGAPVARARVEIVFDERRRASRSPAPESDDAALTDADGRFECRAPGPGPHTLHVTLDPLVAGEPPVELRLTVDGAVDQEVLVRLPRPTPARSPEDGAR